MTIFFNNSKKLFLAGAAILALAALQGKAVRAEDTAAVAAPSVPMSLLDVYGVAKTKSPLIGSVHAGAAAADYSVRDAYFGFLPRASISMDMQRERQDVFHTDNPVYQVGKGYFGNRGYTAQVVQPVVDPVSFADLYYAHAGQRLARAQSDAVQQKLTYNVIEAYLMALAALDDERLARSEESDYAAHRDEVNLRTRRGLGSRTELAQIQAQIDKAHADVSVAHANVGKALATLQRVANMPVTGLLTLRPNIPMAPPTPANPEEWIAMERQLSPELLALAASVDLADAEWKRSLARYLPHIDLVLSDSYLDSGGSLYGGGAKTDERIAELRLTIPLFNADGRGYPSAANHEKLRQARYDSEEKRLEIDERVRTSYLDVKRDSDGADSLTSAVNGRKIVLDDTRRKFASGLVTATDLVDAERDYMRSEREMLGTHYNYLLNTMQLKHAVGQISEDDVHYIDSLLDQSHAYIQQAENK